MKWLFRSHFVTFLFKIIEDSKSERCIFARYLWNISTLTHSFLRLIHGIHIEKSSPLLNKRLLIAIICKLLLLNCAFKLVYFQLLLNFYFNILRARRTCMNFWRPLKFLALYACLSWDKNAIKRKYRFDWATGNRITL